MKRHIPDLHRVAPNGDDSLEGLFLVRVERAFYRWHPQKPFFTMRLGILQPKEQTGQTISGRLYCTPEALWKLLGLRGVVPTSRKTMNGRSFLNLEAFAPAGEWEELAATLVSTQDR